MSFHDLAHRMGKRHGVSAALIADPAAMTRRSERTQHLGMLVFGILLTVVALALTIGLANAGWSWPAVSGALVFSGAFATYHGAKGLRSSLRRVREL